MKCNTDISQRKGVHLHHQESLKSFLIQKQYMTLTQKDFMRSSYRCMYFHNKHMQLGSKTLLIWFCSSQYYRFDSPCVGHNSCHKMNTKTNRRRKAYSSSKYIYICYVIIDNILQFVVNIRTHLFHPVTIRIRYFSNTIGK